MGRGFALTVREGRECGVRDSHSLILFASFSKRVCVFFFLLYFFNFILPFAIMNMTLCLHVSAFSQKKIIDFFGIRRSSDDANDKRSSQGDD